ncbi:MAG TPA: dispase autolysis-inducing protein [Thermoanaerobaculia bacterium]
MCRRFAAVALLAVLLALPAAASKRRAAGQPRPFPPCSMVTGTGAVTFTHDEGRTLAPTSEPLRGIVYTYGLVALPGEENTLMAWHGDDLLLSTDAGCSWRVAATITGWDFPPKLAAAGNGRVYGWSDNRRFLIRYDGRGVKSLKQPADFVGFAVDPNDGDHLRAGGGDGVIWESRDAGETWDPLGRIDATDEVLYRFTFDPHDLDHIVAGMTRKGAFVTRDGGKSWTRATGLGKGNVNAFQFEISPADSNYVYAMAIDLATTGRHIYLSRDGGLTYDPVVTEEPGIKLVNGPTMAAHPANRDVLYFVFGTATQGYGTDLMRFDLATRQVTITHSDYHDIAAIAFSPKDARVMYLGLVNEAH